MPQEILAQREALLDFLMLAQEKLQKPFSDTFKEKLSTMQFCTMAILARNGQLTMGALAERMNMPKQQMTQIINRMVEIDFVQRHADEHDRRVIRISVTPKGDEFVRIHCDQYVEALLARINTLPKHEAAQLLDAIATAARLIPKLY